MLGRCEILKFLAYFMVFLHPFKSFYWQNKFSGLKGFFDAMHTSWNISLTCW